MAYFILNGKFLDANQPAILIDNRAFRYGDGVFETIRFQNNLPVLLEKHLERWVGALSLFGFSIPTHLTSKRIEQEIIQLGEKNKLHNARIRLTGFRNSGGLYDAINPNLNYSIEAYPLDSQVIQLNSNGLRVCLYKDCIKSADAFSHTKNNNYLPYLLGARYAMQNKCNDALIFNQYGRVCDSTKANLFIINHHQIITSPVSEGCIDGIMRKQLLVVLPQLGFSVVEKSVTEEMLFDANHVFLSNAIQVIRWVQEIEHREYEIGPIAEIREGLRRTNPAVFC
jgi:branched-chain amino acid aminotransferase